MAHHSFLGPLFGFNSLGPRVPALIISPLIPKNVVDHTQYDHTSVLATLERLLGLAPLTARDATANPFDHLFTLRTPRTDAPTTLPSPPDWLPQDSFHRTPAHPMVTSAARAAPLAAAVTPDASAAADEPIDSSTFGFLGLLLSHVSATIPDPAKRAELLTATRGVRTTSQLGHLKTHIAERLQEAKVHAQQGTLPTEVAPWFRDQLARN